jgi:hypothetical protein
MVAMLTATPLIFVVTGTTFVGSPIELVSYGFSPLITNNVFSNFIFPISFRPIPTG